MFPSNSKRSTLIVPGIPGLISPGTGVDGVGWSGGEEEVAVLVARENPALWGQLGWAVGLGVNLDRHRPQKLHHCQ